MLTYYLLRVASGVVSWLPLPAGYWLAKVAADISFVFQLGARQHVTANLRQVLGEEASGAEVRAVAREVFRTGAKNYYDLFRVTKLTLDDIRRLVEVRGEEHLEKAQRMGKGAILVSGHVGNLDIVAQVAAARSYRVTVPVEHVRPEKLFNFVTRVREDKGLSFVPVDGGALRAIFRALNGNEFVAIAADRDILRNGTRVKFFGRDTTLPDAPAVLALRTGAPVLPIRSLRRANGTYEVEIRPPIALSVSGNLKEDIRANTQRITAELESLIADHPEQWIVFEPVWKLQEDEKKITVLSYQ